MVPGTRIELVQDYSRGILSPYLFLYSPLALPRNFKHSPTCIKKYVYLWDTHGTNEGGMATINKRGDKWQAKVRRLGQSATRSWLVVTLTFGMDAHGLSP